MARPLWKGAINFGLVHIPVSLWKATRSQDLHFRMLHEKDLVPIKQKKVCPEHGKEVSQDEIIKGYEIRKGEFIPIDDKDLEALEPENAHSIDIEDFVNLSEVDPIYFETSYFISPDKGAARPYRLLVAAMEESGKAAIVRFVMRSKQHLALVRPFSMGLEITTLYYADEVVDFGEIPGIPKADKPAKQELDMAVRLIESMSREFNPENYEDEYREEVLEMIEQKAEGIEPVKQEEPKKKAKVIDLMGALQASLENRGDDKEKGKGTKTTAKAGTKKAAAKNSKKTPARSKKKSVA